MAIRSLSDINSAFESGRFHVQSFRKNAGTSHYHWTDATFSSGKPAYDARVGVPLAFTPCVAQRNDAIYFPGISVGQERYLAEMQMTLWQSTFRGAASLYLFDLVGYYPLIDGDSTDQQDFDNTQTLPRYTDGVGLELVIINHIAPALQNGIAILTYVDTTDTERTITIDVPLMGQNIVCSGSRNTVGATPSSVHVPLGFGSKGIKRLVNITYTTPPGGLHVAYIIKPLATAVFGDNGICMEKNFVSQSGCALPRIYDGAWLGWFDRLPGTTASTTDFSGNFTFIWG